MHDIHSVRQSIANAFKHRARKLCRAVLMGKTEEHPFRFRVVMRRPLAGKVR